MAPMPEAPREPAPAAPPVPEVAPAGAMPVGAGGIAPPELMEAGAVAPDGVMGAEVPGSVGTGPDVEGAIGTVDGVPPAGVMPLGPEMGPAVAGAMDEAADTGAAAAEVMPAGASPTWDAPAMPCPPLTPDATRSGALTEKSGWVRFGSVGTAVCNWPR